MPGAGGGGGGGGRSGGGGQVKREVMSKTHGLEYICNTQEVLRGGDVRGGAAEGEAKVRGARGGGRWSGDGEHVIYSPKKKTTLTVAITKKIKWFRAPPRGGLLLRHGQPDPPVHGELRPGRPHLRDEGGHRRLHLRRGPPQAARGRKVRHEDVSGFDVKWEKIHWRQVSSRTARRWCSRVLP